MGTDVLSKLKEAYISGGGGRKISNEQVTKIGEILVNEFVNKGQTFTTKAVAGIMKANKIGDYSQNKNEEHARLNGAYGVLVRLGIVNKKKPAPKTEPDTQSKNPDPE